MKCGTKIVVASQQVGFDLEIAWRRNKRIDNGHVLSEPKKSQNSQGATWKHFASVTAASISVLD